MKVFINALKAGDLFIAFGYFSLWKNEDFKEDIFFPNNTLLIYLSPSEHYNYSYAITSCGKVGLIYNGYIENL